MAWWWTFESDVQEDLRSTLIVPLYKAKGEMIKYKKILRYQIVKRGW